MSLHSKAFLGPAPEGRAVRIMVTLPSEAATDPGVVRKLMRAGMDCARINCAHDDEAAWARMVEHVREAVADERVKVELAGPAWGSDQPSPLNSKQFERVNRAVREVYAETLVAPGLMLGATDARTYAGLTRNVFRFTPAPMRSEDVERIHGIDERVGIKALADSVTFHNRLLRNVE